MTDPGRPKRTAAAGNPAGGGFSSGVGGSAVFGKVPDQRFHHPRRILRGDGEEHADGILVRLAAGEVGSRSRQSFPALPRPRKGGRAGSPFADRPRRFTP